MWYNDSNVSMFVRLINPVSAEVLDILGIKHNVSNTMNPTIKNLTFSTNTSLPFPKIIMHTRQNLSAVSFLFIIQRKRVLDYIFISSAFKKPRNINVDMAKKDIVTE
jgi:hypothetical protein